MACISTNRPANVPKLEKATGHKFTWFVKPGEEKDYRDAGASSVIEVDGNICVARNKAIHEAGELTCLQISDDYKSVAFITQENQVNIRTRASFDEALTQMVALHVGHNSSYTGVAITNSLLHYTGKTVDINKLIVNDCILIRSAICFDPLANLKEDYDMFVRTVTQGRICLRINYMQMDFPHRNNKGGANDYRTEELERKCNLYVMNKHYGYIQLHKTRKNQLAINYKALNDASNRIKALQKQR